MADLTFGNELYNLLKIDIITGVTTKIFKTFGDGWRTSEDMT